MKKVYEVAIDVISREVIISELSILHTGETTLFVKGICPTWGIQSEYTLSLGDKNYLNLPDILNTNHISAWTDDKQKANEFKAKIEKFLKTIENAANN